MDIVKEIAEILKLNNEDLKNNIEYYIVNDKEDKETLLNEISLSFEETIQCIEELDLKEKSQEHLKEIICKSFKFALESILDRIKKGQ